MSYWDYMRSPASARLLLDFGLERGMSESQMLAGSKLDLRQLGDANVEITAAQELRIGDNLHRLAGRTAWLGMEIGWRYNFSVYGLWGYGLISSATVGEGVALALRYLPLTFAFCDINFQMDKDSVILTFDCPDIGPDLRHFMLERDMVAACVLLRELAGPDFHLSGFNLEHRAMNEVPVFNRVKALLGVVPKLGCSKNLISFDATYLARKLPQANPTTSAMCEQLCQQLMKSRRVKLATSSSVSHYLNVLPANTARSLPELARMTNVSVRTLKRKLKGEGTSYRELSINARKGLAAEMLLDSSASVSDVAEGLGFGDLSTFSQAFKRWYGVSPSHFKRRLQHPT